MDSVLTPTPEVNEPEKTIESLLRTPPQLRYGVEYFHIYTDEKIEMRHEIGVEYLKAIETSWDISYKRIIMVDNYNPTEHVLDIETVLDYLESKDMAPDFWAYEGDLVTNAQLLLDALTSSKLKKNYLQYIAKHNKYPCSLLTATWYLTRLGRFSAEGIIHGSDPEKAIVYEPVERLINLLPQDYKPVEQRARELILKSKYSEDAEKIQDLFYPIDSGRSLDLF